MFPDRTSLRPSFKAWAAVFAASTVTLGLVGEAAGEQRLTFGISQTVRATDNIRLDASSAGTTLYSDTALSFGLQSTTAISSLSLDLSGVARVVDDPVSGSDARLRDPSLGLAYSRSGANSRLDLTAGYDRPSLAFVLPTSGDGITVQDIYTGGGERENIDLGLRFETGVDAPFGVVLDLSHAERNYTGTTDVLLFDTETQSASVSALFRPNDVTELRLDLSESRYEAGDTAGTRRTTQRASLGIEHELSESDRLRASIGQTEVVETFVTLPGTTNITEGVTSSLEYQRDLANGAVAVNLDSSVNSNGRTTTLEFGRQLAMPTGDLDVTFGWVKSDGAEAQPIGRITYRQEFARSALDLQLSRGASVSQTLGQVTESTTLALGYDLDLSPLSSLSLDASLTDITVVGATTGRARSSLGIAYRRELTQDWDMNVGLQHQRFNPDAGSSAQSNSIYVTLDRVFEGLR